MEDLARHAPLLFELLYAYNAEEFLAFCARQRERANAMKLLCL